MEPQRHNQQDNNSSGFVKPIADISWGKVMRAPRAVFVRRHNHLFWSGAIWLAHRMPTFDILKPSMPELRMPAIK
jgi:hypothetical protein